MQYTTIYVAIGVCFLINLIITLAFRAADRKDRTLKSITQQVKNFRSEVSSTMNRMTSTSRDCEENISSRIEHANTVQAHLAESIDLVLVHQRELDDLSGVCENYGNALKKLKVQTEQAENRLYAVQSEVRKIEAVNDFAKEFQKEADRITQQMSSLRADYVRLVASTEQDLKNTAQRQKEENNEMLTLFSQSLDRAKVQFSDYIADEKKAYDDICREQELTAQSQLDALTSHYSDIETKVGDMKAGMDTSLKESSSTLLSMLENIKAEIESLEVKRDAVLSEITQKSAELKSSREDSLVVFENKKDSLFSEMDNKSKCVFEDLESAIKSTENTLEEKLRDKEEEISASLENYGELIEKKEKAVEDDISRLGDESAKALDDFKAKLESLKESADEALSELSSKKDTIAEEGKEKADEMKATLDKAFEELSEKKENLLVESKKALEEEKNALEDSLLSFRSEKERIESEMDKTVAEKQNIFAVEIDALEEKRGQYKERCASILDETIASAKENAQQMFQRIKSQGDDFLKTVVKTTAESERAYHMLTEATDGKIREAEKNLEDLRIRIKETEDSLSSHVEDVTKLKEEIWNLQQEERSLEGEVSSLREDKTNLQNEKAQARSERITEEATLVRLKGQQKKIQEEKESEKNEKKKPLFEEMDIVTGEEEEVDVSDDDD